MHSLKVSCQLPSSFLPCGVHADQLLCTGSFRHTHLSIAAGIKFQTPVQDMPMSQGDNMVSLLHAKLVKILTNNTEDTPANTASCASLRVYFVLVTSYLQASAGEQRKTGKLSSKRATSHKEDRRQCQARTDRCYGQCRIQSL